MNLMADSTNNYDFSNILWYLFEIDQWILNLKSFMSYIDYIIHLELYFLTNFYNSSDNFVFVFINIWELLYKSEWTPNFFPISLRGKISLR